MREIPTLDKRVFISYSTRDGADFARAVRRLIEDRGGLSVWQDIVALKGGRDWWSQIVNAISSESLEHFVLLITPAALASPVVRQEIRLARQEGKTVSPIRGPGIEDLGKLPRWIGQVYDLDVPEHVDTFLSVLRLPSLGIRVPMMVPEPPEDYVQRSTEFDALKRQLLDAQGDSIVVTAALRGAGGYGKTTLACALAHDPDITDAYLDGSLWVVLGENPGNLLSLIGDTITALTGRKPQLDTVDAATSALGAALGDRRILLVIDDAWRQEDLRPFLVGGKRTTRLITTRIDTIAPNSAFRQQVDALTDLEALTLLTHGINDEEVKLQLPILEKLTAQLGHWALLIKLVNGFIRNRMRRMSESLTQALAAVHRRLDQRGILAFDSRNEVDRAHAVARTIGASLSLLDSNSHDRFAELAVFPEDVDIPVSLVERLWTAQGKLDAIDTEELLSWLEDLSLLISLDLSRRVFRLHDTIRHYLRKMVGPTGLESLNRVVADVLFDVEKEKPGELALRRYLFLHVLHHLDQAKDKSGIEKRLLDPTWLQAKLDEIKNPMVLVEDYRHFGTSQFHDYVCRTLQLISGMLLRDSGQLMAQLYGRLSECAEGEAPPFRLMTRDLASKPALLTMTSSLTLPGAETTRLESAAGIVDALTALPNGLLASGHQDAAIRIWDTSSGDQKEVLKRHRSYVRALCLLPDGRLASGSGDGSILIWNRHRSGVDHYLTGHTTPINGLVVASNGVLVSAAGRGLGDLRFWSAESGEEISRIECNDEITALVNLAGDRLAFARKDPTAWNFQIVLWNVKEAKELSILDAHTQSIKALTVLPNGHLVSCAFDKFVRTWDIESCSEVACWKLEHSPMSLTPLPDGRLACGMFDGPVVVLNSESGNVEDSLDGHSAPVTSLAILSDARVASAGWDGIIRLWALDKTNKESRRLSANAPILALAVLDDCSFAAKPEDGKLHIFSSFSSAIPKSLPVENCESFMKLANGSLDPTRAMAVVNHNLVAFTTGGDDLGIVDIETQKQSYFLVKKAVSLFALPGKRLAVGKLTSGAISILSCLTGEEIGALDGHTDSVWAFVLLSETCLVSGSSDNTIRLWDLRSNSLMELIQTDGPIQSLAVIDDSRIAYSAGNSIGVLKLKSKKTLWRNCSHTDWVRAMIVLPGHRLASCSTDKTIRVWNAIDGSEVARLEVDAPVHCIAQIEKNKLIAGDQLGRIHRIEILE